MSEMNCPPAAAEYAAAIKPATVPAPGSAALGHARARLGRRLRQQRMRLHRARLQANNQRYRLFRFY